MPGASAAGKVAYWAHIGGFITGLMLALLVRPGDGLPSAEVAAREELHPREQRGERPDPEVERR